ncbi:hypothetical protein M3Y94_00587300 [Aphelenchoides besseyi]|nr:hypothetical protein M3Y94_00587300 [Aphelenchoides besseyi]
MSTLERAKNEAGRIADEMRDGAEKARQKVNSQILGQDGAYNYTKITQQVRFVTMLSLPLQILALYTQWGSNLGYVSFLIPVAFIAANALLVFDRWRRQVDGRKDIEVLMSAGHNNQKKIHYGLQSFGPFIFALLVHAAAPAIPSSFSALAFNLCDYLTMITTAICLFLDCFEGLKNKVR